MQALDFINWSQFSSTDWCTSICTSMLRLVAIIVLVENIPIFDLSTALSCQQQQSGASGRTVGVFIFVEEHR